MLPHHQSVIETIFKKRKRKNVVKFVRKIDISIYVYVYMEYGLVIRNVFKELEH